MYCVKQKNLISLVERVTHNRFCDRNLLKTGRSFFKKNFRKLLLVYATFPIISSPFCNL